VRIAYLLLHDFRFSSTGPEEFAFRQFHFSKEYARRMAQRGHEVTLYVLNQSAPKAKTIELDGYRLKTFRSVLSFPPFLKFGNSHSLQVLRELTRDSPDLVHYHNYYLWNFPYVSVRVRTKGIPIVAQYHGTDPVKALKAVSFYPALRLVNRLVAPTRKEYDFLRRSMKIPNDKLFLAPSTGVDTAKFKRSGKVIPGQLLYVGRTPLASSYIWEKSPQYLIPLLAAIRAKRADARLIVAGDGPGLDSLKRRASGLGLSGNIDFLGAVRQEDLPALYSSSALTFVPMHMDDIEPYWGGTVQESLACGTPIVAFNRDLPGPRQFGYLVSPGREGAATLVDALGAPERLASMGEAGEAYVRGNCDWEQVVSNMLTVYQELVSK